MAIAEGSQNQLRAGVQAEDQGYVTAMIEGRRVTYRGDGGLDGFSFDFPMPDGMRHNDIMEAVILEIAAGRGEATGRPFSARFAEGMIRDRRAFRRAFRAKHEQAASVEALLAARPELFSA